MKKIFSMAAVAAMMLVSCAKDDGADNFADKTGVVVKLSGTVSPATRTVDNPGSTAPGTIQLTSGHIFVVDPSGNVIHEEALKPTDAGSSSGQRLTEQFPDDVRVYIVGNIAGDAAVSLPQLETFAEIQKAVSAISTQQGVDKYRTAALGNKNGQPAAISPLTAATSSSPAVYVANIVLTPLISRLELVAVQGGANAAGDKITEFRVTGVWLDDDYPQFTYGGSGTGTRHSQGASTDFSGVTGDTANAVATDMDGALVATPGTGKVWGYNVASRGATRLIIRLEGVKWLPAGGTAPGDEVDLSGQPCYLTVTGYNGGTLTEFVRGTIYRIGATDEIDDGSPFEFTPDDLVTIPNSEMVLLDAKISIEEWEIETPSADLE